MADICLWICAFSPHSEQVSLGKGPTSLLPLVMLTMGTAAAGVCPRSSFNKPA